MGLCGYETDADMTPPPRSPKEDIYKERLISLALSPQTCIGTDTLSDTQEGPWGQMSWGTSWVACRPLQEDMR